VQFLALSHSLFQVVFQVRTALFAEECKVLEPSFAELLPDYYHSRDFFERDFVLIYFHLWEVFYSESIGAVVVTEGLGSET